MSLNVQRWTLRSVAVEGGSRWSYKLRDGGESLAVFKTPKLAAEAAERASRRTSK